MTWIGEGESYRVKAGERIAQLLISPIPEVSFKEVSIEQLGDTKERRWWIRQYRSFLDICN